MSRRFPTFYRCCHSNHVTNIFNASNWWTKYINLRNIILKVVTSNWICFKLPSCYFHLCQGRRWHYWAAKALSVACSAILHAPNSLKSLWSSGILSTQTFAVSLSMRLTVNVYQFSTRNLDSKHWSCVSGRNSCGRASQVSYESLQWLVPLSGSLERFSSCVFHWKRQRRIEFLRCFRNGHCILHCTLSRKHDYLLSLELDERGTTDSIVESVLSLSCLVKLVESSRSDPLET